MDPIKAKIQELCPDINLGGFRDAELKQPRYADITLAVVLRAIKKTFLQTNKPYEEACAIIGSLVLRGDRPHWNLAKDRWEDQDEPAQKLIGSLLGV